MEGIVHAMDIELVALHSLPRREFYCSDAQTGSEKWGELTKPK